MKKRSSRRVWGHMTFGFLNSMGRDRGTGSILCRVVMEKTHMKFLIDPRKFELLLKEPINHFSVSSHDSDW